MNFDDLKERYKLVPLPARLVVAFILGLIPGVYMYFDEATSIDEQIISLQAQEQTTRQRFEKLRDRKASLGQAEEQKAFAEEQLAKAKKLIPEDFRIEDVLRNFASIARDVGVKLLHFTPKSETKRDIGYPTMEISIEAEITGRYSDIALFVDRVLRLDGAIFVRSISMVPYDGSLLLRPYSSVPEDEYEAAKEARQNLREKATLVISTYRSQTATEIAGGASSGTQPATPNGNAAQPNPPGQGT